ncbi:Uma2 family endonuclease [Fibrisoma montanum]|uniref:Uma2 family endonuclease n=1 Tax=Fibrisoma montanum TaxID=2305895 RepID=A0A418M4A5_9BACT|nr:Uma2 family endonuclease [Fibrisoma montanum]RIV20588.1 Uma2 family endonuclease [Fibrisoma montanum]
MLAESVKKTYTFDEYEALERAEGVRYEFYDGEVVAMAGTTKRHNLIVNALSRLLYSFARQKGCQVYTENVRQQLRTGERYVYPDVIYTCDPTDLANDTDTIVKSPSLLIEVLSDSTETKDAHDKRLEYFKIPSLQYYIIISQRSPLVEVYERAVDFWKYRVFEGPDAQFQLELLEITLTLREIYEGIYQE